MTYSISIYRDMQVLCSIDEFLLCYLIHLNMCLIFSQPLRW